MSWPVPPPFAACYVGVARPGGSGTGAYQRAVAGAGTIHCENLHRVGEGAVDSEEFGDGDPPAEVVVALLFAAAIWIVVGI